MCYNKRMKNSILKGERNMRIDAEWSNHQGFYIDRMNRTEGYSMASFHIHDQYEIYYEIEGTRRYFIEDGAYLVNAGDVVLINKNQIHKTSAVNNDSNSRIVCNFDEHYLKELREMFPQVNFTGLFQGDARVLKLSVKDQSQVYHSLNQMISSAKDDTPESQAFCKMQLACLLLFLEALRTKQKAEESRKVTNTLVDSIQSYISLHYAEPITLKGLAAQFYISPYYLSRLFKKTVNLSLVEYVNGVRIKAAQNLLEAGEVKISDVAEKTGFATAAHFRRVFKEATGINPQSYRKNVKEQKKQEN